MFCIFSFIEVKPSIKPLAAFLVFMGCEILVCEPNRLKHTDELGTLTPKQNAPAGILTIQVKVYIFLELKSPYYD